MQTCSPRALNHTDTGASSIQIPKKLWSERKCSLDKAFGGHGGPCAGHKALHTRTSWYAYAAMGQGHSIAVACVHMSLILSTSGGLHGTKQEGNQALDWLLSCDFCTGEDFPLAAASAYVRGR